MLRERVPTGIFIFGGLLTLFALMAAWIVLGVWDRPRRDEFWRRLAKSRPGKHHLVNGTNVDNESNVDERALLRSVAQHHRDQWNAVAAEVEEWRNMQTEVRSQLQVLAATVQKVKNDPSRLPSLAKVD